MCLLIQNFFFSRRPPSHLEEKPVASVRPVQSTPIPMMPRQVPMGVPSSSAGFPVNYLQKAGVYVQRVVTTTGTDPSLVVHATSCYVWSLSVCFFMVFMSLLFRYCDPRVQQQHRCPSPNRCRGEYTRYPRIQRYLHFRKLLRAFTVLYCTVGKVYSLHIVSFTLQAHTLGPMMGGYLPSALESQDHLKEEPQLQEVFY